MDAVVVKFGGSSVADNKKLEITANKIINLYKEFKKVVVVVSAQGKMTDRLIKEAEEISLNPEKREMDVLLSVGEQITASKLAILLNYLGYESISFTGWQAGIHTNSENQDAKIEYINTQRIEKELENSKIVIVTGFQGVDDNNNITTLGRGGSDTTAVALATALKTKRCYIFSDVDGIYTADPNKIKNAKKLKNISYKEMYNLSSEGAKVLHDKCVELAEINNVPLVIESTFNNNPGTIVSNKIEDSGVKSIVKKDASRISFIGFGIDSKDEIFKKIIEISDKNDLEILNIDVCKTKISIVFKEKVEDVVLEYMHNEIITRRTP